MSGKRKPARRSKTRKSAPAFFTTGNDIVNTQKKHSPKNNPSKPNPSDKHQNQNQHNSSVKTAYQPTQKKSQHNQSDQTTGSSSKKRPYRKGNFAFIDGQNLNKAVQSQGWNLDYKEFRKYLEEKYNVRKAYMFIGLITTNQTLYSALQDFGYHLVFKPTIANKFGDVKGNVDAEMVLYAITQINQYNKAVIVSGDGDFYTLVQYLQSKGKLEKLLVPNEKAYSALYDTLDVDASFVTDLRTKLEYNKKKPNKS